MVENEGTPDPTARAVLDFWLGGRLETPDGLKQAVARWFANDPALDDAIREQFGSAIDQARSGGFDDWMQSPPTWLALLILLDQFPRNAYRGGELAFASDAKALHVAIDGIRRGMDRSLAPAERVFAYLPLEHAEDASIQRESVRLFARLQEDVPSTQRDMFAVFLGYAEQHRDVIDRFGRFPHRNAVLGRANSDEERAYLSQPDAGF